MAKIYKWKVASAPTGRYRSFEAWSWPMASYTKGDIPAAQIICSDSYTPSRARDGDHEPLKLMIADHSVSPWKWRTIKVRYPTLAETKAGFDRALAAMPSMIPDKVK